MLLLVDVVLLELVEVEVVLLVDVLELVVVVGKVPFDS